MRRTLAQLKPINIIPFSPIISTQNQRFNTPITTLPHLSHSRTYYITSLQLPTDTHHAVGPTVVAALLDDWREKLAAKPHKATETESPNTHGGVGRQQQQQNNLEMLSLWILPMVTSYNTGEIQD